MEFTFNDIEGWFSEADANFVSEIVRKIKNGTMAEVGLFKGKSSAIMMPIAINNNTQYYAVDNFYGGIDASTPASKIQRTQGDEVMKEFIANMKKLGVNRPDYMLWKLDSVSAALTFPNDSLDFVFIDADHAYESVKKDLEVWYNKIKPLGIIGGHDYNNPGVKMAVDEFCQTKKLSISNGGNCFSMVKN